MMEKATDYYGNLSTEQLLEGIAAITRQLKGPLPNMERAWQDAERRDLRAELTKRQESAKEAEGK